MTGVGLLSSASHHSRVVDSEVLVATPPTRRPEGSPSTMVTSVRMTLGRPISTPWVAITT